MTSNPMPTTAYPLSRASPGPQRATGDNAALCRAVLDQLLRQTVISRLRLAHSDAADQAGAHGDCCDPSESAEQLAQALLRDSQHDVDALAERLLRQHDIDTLFLDVMPAAEIAVRLHQDTGDGAEGTLASWRLQEMIERLSPRFQAAALVAPHGCRVLLATGEPQPRGVRLQLTEECLTRDGWDVWCESRGGEAALIGMVHSEWFAMAAIDAAEVPIDQLARMVRGLRRASCNKQLRIMVISSALVRRPDRMARLGADAAAADLRHACAQAKRLLALMPAQL